MAAQHRRDTRGEGSRRIAGYMAEPKNFDLLERIAALAKNKGATTTQVALSWVMNAPAITSAIIGANTVEQLRDALHAVDVHLNADERKDLDRLSAHTQ